MKKKNIIVYVVSGAVLVAFVLAFVSIYENKLMTETYTANQQETEKTTKMILLAKKGNREAYKAERDGKWVVILDGKESAAYDNVFNPVFSDDGSQFAFMAEDGDRNLVVVNIETEYDAYDGATSLVFNSDGSKVAFVASKNKKSVVIVNGEEGTEYSGIAYIRTSGTNFQQIIFSADGNEVIYAAEEDGKVFLVINGEEGKKYDSISEISIDENGQVSYTAEEGDKTIKVVDGVEVSVTSSNSNSSGTGTDSSSGSSGSASSSSGNSSGSSGQLKWSKYDLDRSTKSELRQDECDSASGNCNF